jgi:hypothetical protein
VNGFALSAAYVAIERYNPNALAFVAAAFTCVYLAAVVNPLFIGALVFIVASRKSSRAARRRTR